MLYCSEEMEAAPISSYRKESKERRSYRLNNVRLTSCKFPDAASPLLTRKRVPVQRSMSLKAPDASSTTGQPQSTSLRHEII